MKNKFNDACLFSKSARGRTLCAVWHSLQSVLVGDDPKADSKRGARLKSVFACKVPPVCEHERLGCLEKNKIITNPWVSRRIRLRGPANKNYKRTKIGQLGRVAARR